MKTSSTLAAAMLSTALTVALPAAAIEYTIVEIEPAAGYEEHFLRVTGLNASGQVTGSLQQYRQNEGGTWDLYSQAFVTGPGGTGMTSLGRLGSSTWSEGSGINDAGLVVGTARTADGRSRGFVAAAGDPMVDLGTLGGVNSRADAINARGQIVGNADTASGATRSFLSAPGAGALRDLAPAAGTGVYPRDWTGLNINGAGQVAGSVARTPSGRDFHNIVTGPDGSAPRVVVQPGTSDSTDSPVINDINDNGDVLMTVWNHYYPRPAPLYVIAADGSSIPISVVDLPGWEGGNLGGSNQYGPAAQTQGLALNASRQVGGYVMNNRYGEQYAFITGPDGQDITRVSELDFVGDLSDIPSNFTEVTDINDAGQFVVNAGSRAFLISPIPEPSSVALLLAGAGLVAWRRGRARAA